MATISIYAGKINQMPQMVKNARTAVNSLKTELSNLKKKTLAVDSRICNLDDVISSISATVKTQEDKAGTLDKFEKKSEEFIENTVKVDDKVADKVNQNKDDFYDKYSYLKPDCEKSKWEKFCEGCKKVVDWCKENWVLLVTAAAVIIVAVVAAFCGVAIAAIAAIAGLVALVLFAADAICMLATGGKGIADICNENGLWWLGQIFSGVSIGCDLVTILLPLGAAIKTMSKVGMKTFGKGLIASMKTSFKESMEAIWKNGFKQGFGKGLKNTGKILFKTFIFDIDDITKVDDGVRTWNLMEDKLVAKNPNKNWIDVDGKIYPSHTEIPGQFNPDNLTTKELFEETCKSLGIDMDHIPKDKWGNPDMSMFAVETSNISMKDLEIDIDRYLSGDTSNMSRVLRDFNFENADMNLPDGVSLKTLEERYGMKLTRHEDFNMKRVYYVPSAIHGNVSHNGAIARYKFIIGQITDITEQIIRGIVRPSPRHLLNPVVD